MKHKFLRNKDIVLFSFQPWESEIGFNFKDMAYELARHNRVLFVNRVPDRNSLLQDYKNKTTGRPANGNPGSANTRRREELLQIQDSLWVLNPQVTLESINRIPVNALYDLLNRINNRRIAREINKTLARLDFGEVILINDNDFFRGLYQKQLIPSCKTYIFYIRDFLTIQPFFRKHGVRLEKKMIRNADLVVANSAYLANYSRQWNPRSYDIGQGCELDSFMAPDLPVPADIASIPGPIIGYCGTISAMRLDIEIIRHIALSLPQCSVLLVGPADTVFEKSGLKELKNVHFTGGKDPETIPGYMQHFDICINPQLVNELTIGNYPRKIDEYLAMGKPVVATATDAMEMFREHVFLCGTKEDYIREIGTILEDAGKLYFSEAEKERRRNFALTHSWENSVGTIGDAYNAIAEARTTGVN
ncbi:MAG: glycosyltransferase [Puia sp.]|nr:glycosyltransferase [Puia sp.]